MKNIHPAGARLHLLLAGKKHLFRALEVKFYTQKITLDINVLGSKESVTLQQHKEKPDTHKFQDDQSLGANLSLKAFKISVRIAAR